MKTLKKALCLVLCLAMVASLGVVAASATSFTDDAAISSEYTTAVNVLAGIGVISGTETGAFEPQGTFTRAQAAVLICKALKVAMLNSLPLFAPSPTAKPAHGTPLTSDISRLRRSSPATAMAPAAPTILSIPISSLLCSARLMM